MRYKTKLTSKGTTTIPVEIRRKLGIKPGMRITFALNSQTGEYVLKRSQTIEEVRADNKAALAKAGTAHKTYTSGDGFRQFIARKYRAHRD